MFHDLTVQHVTGHGGFTHSEILSRGDHVQLYVVVYFLTTIVRISVLWLR